MNVDNKWKSEYDKCLLSLNIDRMTEIKNLHLPPLFKYRSFDDKNYWVSWASGDIITTSPRNFNDPFDCMLTYDKYTMKSVIRSACFILLKEYGIKPSFVETNLLRTCMNPVNELCSILESRNLFVIDRENYVLKNIYDTKGREHDLQDDLRIASFSESGNSILMWSHYAENHKGFCIKYDFTSDDFVKSLLYPITYNSQRIIVTPKIFSSKGWVTIAALCKAPEWSYENEWRFLNKKLDGYSENTIYKVSVQDSIKGIYIGANVDIKSKNAQKLISIAGQHKFPIYQMTMNGNEYKLDIGNEIKS